MTNQHKVAKTFLVVDYVMETKAKKYCKYARYRSYEQ